MTKYENLFESSFVSSASSIFSVFKLIHQYLYFFLPV